MPIQRGKPLHKVNIASTFLCKTLMYKVLFNEIYYKVCKYKQHCYNSDTCKCYNRQKLETSLPGRNIAPCSNSLFEDKIILI